MKSCGHSGTMASGRARPSRGQGKAIVGAPQCVSTRNAACDAARAGVMRELAPQAAQELSRAWREGTALAQWARTAPSAQVEVARVVQETWYGTARDLIHMVRTVV